MKRPVSALTAIGGFSVAVAALSVATTASIVLLMPEPPARRMTVTEAVAALRGEPARGTDTGRALERRAGPSPPSGTRSFLLESLLATRLGRPLDTVRVVWAGRAESKPQVSKLTLKGKSPRFPIVGADGRQPTGVMNFVLRQRGAGGGFEALSPTMAANQLGTVLSQLPQPPFVAAVRGADGRWISVATREPIFGGWRLKILAAFALSLLLLAPLAWLFARRLTRPFRTLAAAIGGDGELPRVDGPRELRDAGDAIIQLRARLAEEAEERMRMLTAVAHDLRTPLTSLKLRIEIVPEPQRAKIIADTNRMQAMVDEVLAFARAADAPRQLVVVRDLVAEVIADMSGANVNMRLTARPDGSVMVVKDSYRRAVENLVQNAIDYADGGDVQIMADDATVTVMVSDNGPGIKQADRARMVRPFERGDASRNRQTGGAGLGLSIVQNFAELHGGSLSFVDVREGGACAVLRLPRAWVATGPDG